MKTLGWIIRTVLFLLLLGFAIKNTEAVTLHFFMGTAWTVPLVVALLGFLVIGALLGMSAMLGPYFHQRREASRLRKQLKKLEAAESAPRLTAPDLHV